MNAAVTISATAIARWMVRRGQCTTMPVPNQAPMPPASTMHDDGRDVDQPTQQDDVDDRFDHGRDRVADVERARGGSRRRPGERAAGRRWWWRRSLSPGYRRSWRRSRWPSSRRGYWSGRVRCSPGPEQWASVVLVAGRESAACVGGKLARGGHGAASDGSGGAGPPLRTAASARWHVREDLQIVGIVEQRIFHSAVHDVGDAPAGLGRLDLEGLVEATSNWIVVRFEIHEVGLTTGDRVVFLTARDGAWTSGWLRGSRGVRGSRRPQSEKASAISGSAPPSPHRFPDALGILATARRR